MTATLLTEIEAAAMIGWSASNLRARRGRLANNPNSDAAPASLRVGGSVRYRPQEIKRWIARNPEYDGRAKKRGATISQDQACKIMRIGRSTLRERRSQLRAGYPDAAPQHVAVGQEIRYRREDVLAWLDREEARSTAPRPERPTRYAVAWIRRNRLKA